jgi:chemotaxis family two-component system sensor kinase Cph1
VQCEVVLTRALDNLQRTLQESGALVTHDPLPTVKGDDTQLVQVFQNLIGNGIKFRGNMTPCMHVSAKEKTEDWVFAIQDNGIGIDPQYADRIFVIFQRLHSHAEYPGSGIGLAICKKVIENHDGRIWFESQPGKGTTFYFTIPKTDLSD